MDVLRKIMDTYYMIGLKYETYIWFNIFILSLNILALYITYTDAMFHPRRV